jgi:hypothetical protein
MDTGGLAAAEQLLGDLAVRPPSCHQDQHLGLAPGQAQGCKWGGSCGRLGLVSA